VVSNIQLFQQFKGYAYTTEDVQWGEGETVSGSINHNGVVLQAKLSALTLTLTLRGLLRSQATSFIQEAQNNRLALFNIALAGESLEVNGRTITRAVLVEAVPSKSITYDGLEILESLRLEYRSLEFV
jgi:hypothetical protein